jgi:hypothetical protein
LAARVEFPRVPFFIYLFRANPSGTALACEGLSLQRIWRTIMPLFLLPYLFMQLAVSGGTNARKTQCTPDPDDADYSPSLPSPDDIAEVLR